MRWAKDNTRNNALGERNDGRGKKENTTYAKGRSCGNANSLFVIENDYQYRLTDLIVVGNGINE